MTAGSPPGGEPTIGAPSACSCRTASVPTVEPDLAATRRPALAAFVGIVVFTAALGALVWATTTAAPPIERPPSASVDSSAFSTLSPEGADIAGAVGRWSGEDGTLRATEVPPGAASPTSASPRAVLLTGMNAADGLVAGVMDPSAPGWSLVFRWAGPDDYGIVIAAPRFAAWKVVVVRDGVPVELATFAPAAVDNGTVVEVSVVGSTLVLWLDGVKAGTTSSIPTDLGSGWGTAGDARTVGTGGWSAVRSAPLSEGSLPADGPGQPADGTEQVDELAPTGGLDGAG